MNRDIEIIISRSPSADETVEMKRTYDFYFPRLRASAEIFSECLALDSSADILSARLKSGGGNRLGGSDGFAVVYGGALLLLTVAPELRCRGIGSALLEQAEKIIFKDHDAVTLGHDGGTYLLTGVPADSPGAWEFFERRGYVRSWTACDLVADLHAYSRRPDLCYSGGDIAIRPRGSSDIEKARARACGDRIEGWGEYYASSDNVIVADRGGDIIGAVIAGTDGCMFSQSLPGAGELGCLGVLEEYRGRGVGTSLCSAALDSLASAGCASCFIGYTWLDKWYGKFGAVKYAEYVMGEKRR